MRRYSASSSKSNTLGKSESLTNMSFLQINFVMTSEVFLETIFPPNIKARVMETILQKFKVESVSFDSNLEGNSMAPTKVQLIVKFLLVVLKQFLYVLTFIVSEKRKL